MKRCTISRPVTLAGPGRDTRRRVAVALTPAPAGAGISVNGIPARIGCAAAVGRSTCLRRGRARVGMVEHLLAATSILGITDLDAAVHGGELPLLDGSSLPYVRALRRAGIVRLAGHITPLTPAAAVVRDRSGCAAAAPARRFTVTVVVGPPASRSWSSSSLTAPEFAAGAAPARTFGPCRAPGRLRLPFAVRLRRGLWFPARQRVPDEPCRHKLLDLLGDLALLGRPLRAQVVALRPSHRLNLALVRILDRQTEKP